MVYGLPILRKLIEGQDDPQNPSGFTKGKNCPTNQQLRSGHRHYIPGFQLCSLKAPQKKKKQTLMDQGHICILSVGEFING